MNVSRMREMIVLWPDRKYQLVVIEMREERLP